VSLADLLQLGLDLLDRLVFQVLDLLERALDHAQSLRVDLGCRKKLIYLRILGL
jgi:hypothetical protein